MVRSLAILAATLLLAGCDWFPPPQAGMMMNVPTPDPVPTPEVRIIPQVVEVGAPFELPGGTTDRPITWRLVDRDRDAAKLSAGGARLLPLRPGGLTLEVSAGGRTGWVHYAVRAKGLTSETISAIPHRPFGVGGPVVIRAPGAWARVWSGWWQPPGTAVVPPRPPTNPDGTPNLSPPAEPPGPPAAPGVAFETRSVLLVDLDHGGEVHGDTVVTHIEGATVHLATPAVRFADEPPAAPAPGVSGHALAVPALPRDVSLAMASFQEGTGFPTLVGTREITSPPWPDALPALVRPVGLPDHQFERIATTSFRAFLPLPLSVPDPEGLPTTGQTSSELDDGMRPAWRGTVRWAPTDKALEALAAALQGEVAVATWAGVPARVARQVAPVDGRKATIERHLAVRGGLRVEATFVTFADVDQALGYAELGAAVLAAWQWR